MPADLFRQMISVVLCVQLSYSPAIARPTSMVKQADVLL